MNVRVGVATVCSASEASAYHSYVVEAARLLQLTLAVVPTGTALTEPICVNGAGRCSGHVVRQRELAVRVRLELIQGRRVGLEGDGVVRGRERHGAQPAVAAVRAALVVGQDRANGPAVEDVAALPLAADVAAQQQEQVRIVLQVVVDRLSLSAEGARDCRSRRCSGSPRSRAGSGCALSRPSAQSSTG